MGDTQRIRQPVLSAGERALLVVAGLNLVVVPWFFGGMALEIQIVSFVLSACALGLAFRLRRKGAQPTARKASRAPLWIGLPVMGYALVQWCNPAWSFANDDHSWWLEPTKNISWLPAGVSAPLDRFNPGRSLLVWGAAWMNACAIWLGFGNRGSLRLLFATVACGGAAVALFGIVQRLSGAEKIFSVFEPGNKAFIGSFIYPNHAGAYFNLIAVICAALALAKRESSESNAQGRQALFYLALGGITVICCLFTLSRMSILLLIVFGVVLSAHRCIGGWGGKPHPEKTKKKQASRRVAIIVTAVTLAAGGGLLFTQLGPLKQRFADFASNPGLFIQPRLQVAEASVDMWQDRWLFGWGAGCFRHGFPLYAQQYPDIYYIDGGYRIAWEHAHNDWLQALVELGVLGCLPMVAGLAWGIGEVKRTRAWRHATPFALLIGCALACLHAGVDFIFQNPSVLMTWLAILAGALRWAAFSNAREIPKGPAQTPLAN